jgi:hypothetical protein
VQWIDEEELEKKNTQAKVSIIEPESLPEEDMDHMNFSAVAPVPSQAAISLR